MYEVLIRTCRVLFKEVFTELKQDVQIDFADVILVILDFFITKTSFYNKCEVMLHIYCIVNTYA